MSSDSSRRWLQRQRMDPYVGAARRQGFRSRSAFKLCQLDDKFRLFRPGMQVVELGAAPGGWTQVVVARIGGDNLVSPAVFALDQQEMEPIPGATIMQGDFLDEKIRADLRRSLKRERSSARGSGQTDGQVDWVLSDMATSSTGLARLDHLRIMALAESALVFAEEVLCPGGGFLCKLFHGGAEVGFQQHLRQCFARVRYVKPPASRSDSTEVYLLATGYRAAR